MQAANSEPGVPQSSPEILEALLAIARAVGELREPAALARVAVERAYEQVGGDGACIYVWNESSGVLQPLSATGADVFGPFPALAAGEGATGQAFLQRRPLLVRNYSNWEHAVDWAVERNVQQVVAVPMLVAARAIGVLVLPFVSSSNSTPKHVEMLALISAQVAPALEAAVLRINAERQVSQHAASLEHLPAGVVVLDAAGHVITLNAEGRRLSGAGPDRGQPLAEQSALYQARSVQTGQVLPPEETAAARALRGEHVLDADYLYCPPGSNQELWTRVSAVPIRDADGLQTGAVAVFHDITQERKLLDELERNVATNARLAHELADRQRRIQDQLRAVWSVDRPAVPTLGSLSARELQVLRLMARGETNRKIGAQLGISAGTVRNHVEHILAKLGVADRTQASVRASELGLIGPQARL